MFLKLTYISAGTIYLIDQAEPKEISQTLSRTGLAEMHLPRLTPNYHLSIAYARTPDDNTVPKPVIEPPEPRIKDFSSSALGPSPTEPDDQGTSGVLIADVARTYELLAVAGSDKNNALVVAEAGSNGVSHVLEKATTDASSNTATLEKVTTTKEVETRSTTAIISWVSVITIAWMILLAYIYLDHTPTLSPFSNSHPSTELGTGLTLSFCGKGECNEGTLINVGDIAGDSYGEPLHATTASSEPKLAYSGQDWSLHESREARFLNRIDRALGWKGQ